MKITNRIFLILVAVYISILGLPNIGQCRTLGQPLSSTLSITSEEFKKNSVREALVQDYKSGQFKSDNRIKSISKTEDLQNDARKKSTFQQTQPPFYMAGGWTGGGGSGIICFREGENSGSAQLMDEFGRLSTEAYENIQSIETLDTQKILRDNFIPVRSGETPISYLERILNENYGSRLPLFSQKLGKLIRIVGHQMQDQLYRYEVSANKIQRPQLTLRDYGVSSLTYFRNLPQHCRVAQMATRYAKTGFYNIKEFFIDFDEALVLKMRKLAKTSEQAVIMEASLILHEAAYLIASSIEHTDSSVMAFGFVPYFLSQNSLNELTDLSRGAAARLIRSRLKTFDLNFYQRWQGLSELDSTNLPNFGLQIHRWSFEINQAMLYADMVGLNYGAAISGPALTKSRLEDYQNYPEFRKIMRSSNYWNVALVDFIADSGSNEFAFSLLIALIEPPGDGVIDDLILQTPFFAEIAKINFCGEIKRQKEIYEKENVKTYLKMNLILERALKICR